VGGRKANKADPGVTEKKGGERTPASYASSTRGLQSRNTDHLWKRASTMKGKDSGVGHHGSQKKKKSRDGFETRRKSGQSQPIVWEAKDKAVEERSALADQRTLKEDVESSTKKSEEQKLG